MDPSTIAFIKAAVAFVLVSGTGLSAYVIWARERRRGRPEADKVLETLREENAALQAELGSRLIELEERVDFVERRYVQPPKGEPLPERRVATPV